MFTTPTTSVSQTGPVAGVRSVQSAVEGSTGGVSQAKSAPAPSSQDAPLAPAAPAASSLKLVVAKAQESMAFTYTLVDQTTGRVVAQIPHEAAEQAAANPNYTAGGVVDTTA